MFSSQRFSVRGIFALLVLSCLFTALLFTGCQQEPNGFRDVHFIPVGEWTDDWGGGYTITNTTVKYFTADSEWEGVTYPGVEISGTIEIAHDFSHNSGVLIIKITNATADGLTNGKYTGVYYRDYTSSHVLLANPIDAAYAPIQKDTFADAEKTFNADNVDTHVTMWGSGYSK